MKNENGTGTVYKLNGKRRKPWVARVTTGYSLDGKQIRKTLGTFPTKREAQEYLLQYNKNPLLFSKITFGEVKDMWWAEYITTVKEVTKKNSRSQLKKLKPLFDIPIADINLMTLQKLMNEINGNLTTKAVLNMIFDYAVKYDFVDKNKVKFTTLQPPKKPVERRIFTSNEIKELWIRLSNTSDSLEKEVIEMTLILIYTGLRNGELRNLKNKDIDLENKIIYITDSKTKNGIRKIPIHNKILHLIKKSSNKYLYECNGKKLLYNTLQWRFTKYIPGHTLHDTRHTFASMLNNADANQTSITKLVGHSSFDITETIYTHKDVEELRKAINLLN